MNTAERSATRSQTPSTIFAAAVQEFVEAIVDNRLEALKERTADPPTWMTVREAAAHLRLTEPAIRKRVQRGQLPANRDGSRLLFDRAELDSRVTLVAQSTNWGERRTNGPAPWPQED